MKEKWGIEEGKNSNNNNSNSNQSEDISHMRFRNMRVHHVRWGPGLVGGVKSKQPIKTHKREKGVEQHFSNNFFFKIAAKLRSAKIIWINQFKLFAVFAETFNAKDSFV